MLEFVPGRSRGEGRPKSSIIDRGLMELVFPFFRAVMVKAAVSDRESPDLGRKVFPSQPVRIGRLCRRRH